MQTPAPGSTLTGSTVTFTWSAGSGATAYWLDIGNVAGGNEYYQSGNLGNVLTTTATYLPTDGSTVYVTLYTSGSGQWLNNAYTYTAYSASSGTGHPNNSASRLAVHWHNRHLRLDGWPRCDRPTGSTPAALPAATSTIQSGNLGNVLTTTVNNCRPMAARFT